MRRDGTLSADEEEEPKGEKDRTVPPLVPQLTEILVPSIRGRSRDERVVLDRNGRTPSRNHVLTRLVELQRRRKTPKRWSVHALRHAFCSHLVRVGVGVEAVRALADHSSIRVTNRYVHATDADLQHAMQRGFRSPRSS